MRMRAWLERLEQLTRPVHPETERVLRERWSELPEAVHTPAQLLGRHAVGCEGTHGVFPRCNLTCTPCYHSVDANRVRVAAGTPSPRSTPRWPTCGSGAARTRTPSSSAAR